MPPQLSRTQLSMAGKIGAHKSWANTTDRTARTANGRKAFNDRFLELAGGDPKRAESMRREHYARMAYRSAQARRRRKIVAERIAELDSSASS